MKNKVLAVVIARAGSKGIKEKNLQDINGKPLVAHIISSAVKASADIPFEVVLSTDCTKIQTTGIKAGANAPFLRPKELAGDHIESLPVVQHAVNYFEDHFGITYDYVIYLQPTAPLTRPKDISHCLQTLIDNKHMDSVVAITKVSTHPFKMKRLLEDGRIVNYIDQGFEDMRPRQELPPVYRRAGSIYASKRDVIMKQNTLVGNKCIGFEVPSYTAIDIDTLEDLELARLLHKKYVSCTDECD